MILLWWVSLAILLYIYVGYPLLVWGLAQVWGRDPTARDILPTVSLLIPAYNEAAHIEHKLRNALALDYPGDRLDIVVASDGSTDGTEALARAYEPQGVRVVTLPRNHGKAAMLTRVAPSLRGELLVFSDASSELAPGALRALVRPFADPQVGCVSGCYRLVGTGDARGRGEGLYWRYETFLKRQEGRLHSILGAHGAFYAVRRALFRPLADAAINDDYLIPMWIVEQGYRAVYEPAALAWERERATVAGEFARRRRIAAGNCQQIAALRRLLHPRYGWIAFAFLSHKVLRTFAPLVLLTLAAATCGLPPPWRALAGGGQAIWYGSAMLGARCQRGGRAARVLAVPFYFCLGNLAMLAGILSGWGGRRRPAWGQAR